MTLLTILEIKGSYPDDILITSAEYSDGKFASFMYLLRGESIHKLMLSTNPVFDSKDLAETYMKDIAEAAVNYETKNNNYV